MAGEEYVSLRSLQPDFTYTFDLKSLQLSVIAQSAELLGTQRLDLGRQAPENATYERAPGTFFNYAITKSTAARPNGFFENGITLGRALLYNSFSYTDAGRFTHGISQMIFDSRLKVRRTIVGDAPITTGQLGGSQLLGGVVVARQFGLNPYLLTFPTPSFQGQVLLPSQAEIYVNGQLVRTIDLEPGQFTLQDIPTEMGFAQTRVVIRNAAGVTTQQGNTFFSTSGLLKPGLSDFAFGFGLSRSQGVANNGYGDAAFLARYAVGVSDRFTGGARFEMKRGVVSGGFTGVRTLGRLAIGFSGAASAAGGLPGTAAALQVALPSRGALGVGATAQWASSHYATTSMGPLDPRPLFDTQFTASLVVSRTTAVTAALHNLVSSLEGPSSSLSVGISQQLGHEISLFAQAGRIRGRSALGGTVQNAFSINLSRPLGPRNTVGASLNSSAGSGGSSRASSFSFAHSTNGEFGLAYDANVGLGNARTISAAARYQGAAGSAQAFFSDFGGSSGLDLSLAGGLAYTAKHFFLTRTIQDAYGVVELPGLGGAEVFSNGRSEGRTNKAGFLLVPDLVSELPNDVTVSLPPKVLDATFTGKTTRVVPDFRSAVYFPYQVQRVRALLVSLLLQRKKGPPAVPQYGKLTVTGANGGTQSSEIDGTGRAYFNQLAEGRYNATLEYETDICHFTLDVPARDQVVFNLGVRTCVE